MLYTWPCPHPELQFFLLESDCNEILKEVSVTAVHTLDLKLWSPISTMVPLRLCVALTACLYTETEERHDEVIYSMQCGLCVIADHGTQQLHENGQIS